MRLTCPLCGPRDRREFTYYGAADYLRRPDAGAGPAAWDDYLHNRDNPAGVTRDLWYHELGCSAWLELTRDTRTHEILAVRAIVDGPGGAAPSRPAAPSARPPRARRAAAPRAPKEGQA